MRLHLQNMAYTFAVYHSIQDLPEAYKNRVLICKGIDMVEKANVPNIQNYYVITYEGTNAIYFAYFQLLSVKTIHFNLGNKKIQQLALCTVVQLLKPTLLVVGNLFRHDALFFQYNQNDISAEKKAEIYQATVDHMVAYTNASGIFLKDVDPSNAKFIQADNSYTPMLEDISMEMNLPAHWLTFSDYENELKHKYVQRCKKIRKSFKDVQIRELSLEDVEKYSIEMEQLYLQVTQKQLVSMGILNPIFFVEMKKVLQENYKVCGYFYQDRLIAFSSAILHDDEFDMNYIGFDYTLNSSLNLYFNILFYCLEHAISLGRKKLVLGRTAPEAKAILGCEPDYRFSYYKLRNVIVNWFYQMVAGYFKEQQGDSWKDRHPFKSSYYTKEKSA